MQDSKRFAAIDLGSNTFHFMAVESHHEPPYFNVLHKERHFVYLLGPNAKHFEADAIVRAVDSLEKFQELISKYDIPSVKTVATAAFRLSENYADFIEAVAPVFKHSITTISGEQEASYAFKGVQLMNHDFSDNNLIVDIGGGSVELIFFDKNGTYLVESLKMGITFLRHHFDPSDPIKEEEKIQMFGYFDNLLFDFWSSLPELPNMLIGMSGPFEIIEHMTSAKPSIYGNAYSSAEILKMSQQITSKTAEGRKNIELMPKERYDLSKESFLIIEYLLKKCKSINSVMVSPFGIKEGIVSEALNLV
ncbi:MAG: hypothetical protein HKO66_16935 [Saprospiraceae bacterium]|nr:hypothetical protein [Bacteroidia bacterium]NNL93931.1 hypothetical protein [Saprospiraceae bacterium]